MKIVNKSMILSLCLALLLAFTACSNDVPDVADTSVSQSSEATTLDEHDTPTEAETDNDVGETADTSETTQAEETPTEKPTTAPTEATTESGAEAVEVKTFSLSDIPAFDGSYYVAVNDNVPFFSDSEMTDVSFERYSPLDSLGRCGVATASVGLDIMPTEDRESISSVYPTGWVQAEYSNVSGGYLYNRCHILGFQLTGENANERNLITGTRSMNVDGMLLFENMVADYVQETGNHVYMRVTPIFEGNNLLATGVLMEAKSVEDDGEGVLYNVFCYNVQDGLTIDYATGESSSPYGATEEAETTPPTTHTPTPETETHSIAEIDTNGNGTVTIAEAKAAGFSMPITSDHWLYQYMKDADGDGVVGE